ncbi:Class II receptor tyrosine kinase, partial [Geodia barretti]
LTLSSPPPTGATESPDLGQPDSVSLTCSVASPPTGDYQYQWQWWRNGTQLSNTDTRFSITHSTNTQSSSLVISGLRYSDAGDYMCTVEYGACPDGVDCSGTTPVTGNIRLDLPLKVEVKSSGLVVREGSEVIVLTCEVYGYPRDSSPPKWSSPGRNLETGRFITTLSDTGPLSGGSVSSTDKVTVSQLTIYCASETDNGEYTCSVDGESTSFRVDLGNSETGADSNESLTGAVVGLAVLLLVSVTINLLLAAHWMYTLRGRGTKSGGEGPGNQEQLYEVVDGDQQLNAARDEVSLKTNVAYGKISTQNTTSAPNTAL